MQRKHRLPLLLVLLTFTVLQVYGITLTHDISTGSLTGIDVSGSDSPNYPGGYTGATEYYETHTFLGRVVYAGPPTTFTFSNAGPTARYAYNNRFYFTYVQSDGTSVTTRWREFFLVTRAKGMRHGPGDVQHDFSGVNTPVANEGGTITIPYGAGSEEVAVGETGYNTNGVQGTYDGTNSFKYRYPYRHIWVDVILIRTNTSRSLRTGRYESQFTVTTSLGNSLLVQVAGYYGNPSYEAPPSFHFKLEKTIEDDFPFSRLSSCTSPANSLPVGICVYHAEEYPATIRFAADRAGTSDSYLLRNEAGEIFSYRLAFDATNPDRGPVAATLGTSFATSSSTVYSPLDGTTNHLQVLEGTVNIYLPTPTYPHEGRYTSTIYCLITHTD